MMRPYRDAMLVSDETEVFGLEREVTIPAGTTVLFVADHGDGRTTVLTGGREITLPSRLLIPKGVS